MKLTLLKATAFALFQALAVYSSEDAAVSDTVIKDVAAGAAFVTVANDVLSVCLNNCDRNHNESSESWTKCRAGCEFDYGRGLDRRIDRHTGNGRSHRNQRKRTENRIDRRSDRQDRIKGYDWRRNNCVGTNCRSRRHDNQNRRHDNRKDRRSDRKDRANDLFTSSLTSWDYSGDVRCVGNCRRRHNDNQNRREGNRKNRREDRQGRRPPARFEGDETQSATSSIKSAEKVHKKRSADRAMSMPTTDAGSKDEKRSERAKKHAARKKARKEAMSTPTTDAGSKDEKRSKRKAAREERKKVRKEKKEAKKEATTTESTVVAIE